MGIVAAIAAGAGALIGGYSAYAQGQTQAKIAAYNATIAQQNAKLTAEQLDIAKREKEILAARLERKTKRILAAQRARFLKAGVEYEGTPLLVAAETLSNAEIDALAIRYASTVEQSQILAQKAAFEQEAALSKMRGKQAKIAGYLSAGTSLLTGLERTGSYGMFEGLR